MRECKRRNDRSNFPAKTTQVYCGMTKDESEFYVNGSGRLDAQCKKCKNKSTVLRRKENPLANLSSKIRANTRTRVYDRGWGGVNNKFNKILGCDREVFIEHLESTFKEGMSWDNIAEWQVDHIIPLGSAKSIDELYELAHYTNIQALWPRENIQKSNSLAYSEFQQRLIHARNSKK